MKIAYLVNQYPKVSHSFIRREILGLEACGLEVVRFSIRSCSTELVDAADKAELKKTQVVLEAGVLALLSGLLQAVLTRPVRLLLTIQLAIKLGWHSERGMLRHLIYLVEACLLLKWFHEANVSHVHAHFGTNSTTVALLCRALGGPPYSFTVHGPEEFDKVTAIALPQKVERAAFVVAISNFGRSQLYRWCPVAQWSKVHVVHCGVDSAFFNSTPTPIPSDPKLVCVGRLCAEKGQLLLLEAAGQLMRRGLAFKLVLVGDGPLRSELEATIARLGLHDHVEITGWADSDQVRQAILNARVLVLPSFAEGLPVVIMEALALGRPVISTYVAGIPELVEPGVCGWLVPPGSVEALMTAIQSAMEASPATLEQWGSAGAKRVAEQHNVVIEVGKLKTLFQSALQSEPAFKEELVPGSSLLSVSRTTKFQPQKHISLD
ncbi:glycosyltransferase [Phormidium sp. FACHB-592]|uniref:Glycosyltransferase n=1 Tax=Stenomitos frigidus AS-A4 TaxID=2933935 RepID=A0ABV0KLJ3_9CYAN|nr:glycosyltransferase [Phormidium sp. FACHB-592]MBD2075035.1 glycosyltransferase [Phormidium sp. FACHB-592]